MKARLETTTVLTVIQCSCISMENPLKIVLVDDRETHYLHALEQVASIQNTMASSSLVSSVQVI